MNQADNDENDQVSSLEQEFNTSSQPNHPFDESNDDMDEDREVGLEQDPSKETTCSEGSDTKSGGGQRNHSTKGVSFDPIVNVNIIPKQE